MLKRFVLAVTVPICAVIFTSILIIACLTWILIGNMEWFDRLLSKYLNLFD